MQLQFYANGPLGCQRHVKSRYQNFAESVANLKFAQRRMLLIAIVKHPINQVRHLFFFAQCYRFGNKGIGRSLVVMTGLGQKRQDRRHVSAVNQLQNSDQFFFKICANVITSIEIIDLVALDLLQSLAVVREHFALTQTGIIIQFEKILQQSRIKLSHFYDDAAFL